MFISNDTRKKLLIDDERRPPAGGRLFAMVKTTIILAVLMAPGGLSGQKTAEPLSFKEKVCDFGQILEKNGKVSHTFVFENTSPVPVLIDETGSGCGCTTHDYPKEPVLPGRTGKITITYNPAYRPGFFSKEIVVYSNSRKNLNRLWVKGTVIPTDHPVEEDYPYHFGNRLYFNLKVLSFGRIEPRQSKQLKLRYANASDQSMTLGFITENKNIVFTNPGKLSPGERGETEFVYRCPKATADREIIINIYPVINDKRSQQPLQARIAADGFKPL
ncbi:MAG: DUF1573 domain-containing protein [Prolixibacteraceae bacterium]